MLISWNSRVPLPRDWPHRTHVAEVLPGSAVPWIAANGGYENFVANRWGPGCWTLQEVSPDAKPLASFNVAVPDKPGTEPREGDWRNGEREATPDPDRITDKDWARHWGASFVEEHLEESSEVDAVDLYRMVVERLAENADLIRNNSFDIMIKLTGSVVREAGGRLRRSERALHTRLLPQPK